MRKQKAREVRTFVPSQPGGRWQLAILLWQRPQVQSYPLSLPPAFTPASSGPDSATVPYLFPLKLPKSLQIVPFHLSLFNIPFQQEHWEIQLIYYGQTEAEQASVNRRASGNLHREGESWRILRHSSSGQGGDGNSRQKKLCAPRQRRVNTKAAGVERSHTWFNWSKGFMMESGQRRDTVEKGPLYSAREFRRGQGIAKGF